MKLTHLRSSFQKKKAEIFNDLSSIQDVISQAQRDLMARQEEGQRWNFHASLGLHFISQYCLFNRWFGHSHTRLDEARLVQLILKGQRADGSWMQIKNTGREPGDINATIFNYWALKALGYSTKHPALLRAREFILARGGIEGAALFTKVILALFDNYPWTNIPFTPYLIFNESMPINHTDFSQWTIPHLMAVAYLRDNCVTRNLGPQLAVDELWLSKPEIKNKPARFKFLLGRDETQIEKILAHQQPGGSWGGYTLSTILSMMAIDDFSHRENKVDRDFIAAVAKGFHFIEDLYFGNDKSAYQGALMDGHYWDTILIGHSLVASGVDLEAVRPAADYILTTQQRRGGFPYGRDFEYAPDVDDTAEAILFLLRFGDKYKAQVDRAVLWLCSMQNSDGGWGAFDKDNNGNFFLRMLTKEYCDSVDLFDDSSADLTGHILEALGAAGLNKTNSQTVRKGVDYLKNTQDKNGGWIGRWGINYIYGTTCALAGLYNVGESVEEPYVAKALTWLESVQNPDGGFGETQDSYLDAGLAGVGVSTPSQTAWALIALTGGGLAASAAAQRAARYLVTEFKKRGRWVDESVVGTGHPGILYMNYPSYECAFPLMALSGYADTITDGFFAGSFNGLWN